MEIKEIFTIFHLVGVVFGAGGAIASDFMFFKSLKDMKISKTEMGFLTLGSKMVWIGLIIIIVSGGLIFNMDPDHYIDSSKFLAKMTIVGVILLNGILLHLKLIPHLKKHLGKHLPYSPEFTKNQPVLFASGAVSITSWIGALVLGSLHKVPFSYSQIMVIYLGIVTAAILFSVFVMGAKFKKNHE